MSSAQILSFIQNYTSDQPKSYTNLITTPYFFKFSDDRSSLSSVFNDEYSTFVELTPICNVTQLESHLNFLLVKKPDICVSLSTITCYKLSPAVDISDMLAKRFALSDEKTSNIQTCLQEVIMNSIFHGNLKVPRKFNNINDFEAYQDEVANRLADDGLRYKRINVTIWNEQRRLKIAIMDDGEGLDLPEKTNEKIDDIALTMMPHGRGFMFIRNLSNKMFVSDDRKTLYMFFNK